MRIKNAFVRFYKSFNYDYLRKVHPGAQFDSWDMIDGSPYPFVRVPLEPDVTTIVGANESGKSHLLTAIEKSLTGEGIEREDFCRYSQFFTVEQGKTRWPEFGFELTDLDEQDRKTVVEASGVADASIERFLLFRQNRNQLTIYLPSREKYSTHPVIPGKEAVLLSRLPRVVHMRSNVALPDSVPILALLGEVAGDKASGGAAIPREKRFEVLDKLAAVAGQEKLFESDKSVQENAAAIRVSLSSVLQAARSAQRGGVHDPDGAIALTRDLLFTVARVDRDAIVDLVGALREGNDGHVNGLMQKINDHLAATLNFPHWWVQDRDFRLVVTARDSDLVLTIRDRTGTEYSFSERSGGLKYFLSYYVQYRAHRPMDARPEVLLMDEPDAHLSSEGQQDLLKIFEAFANPMDDRKPVQVVYVTHSPFLIDKNHAGRIRVLEKGVSEEGTRVVRDAARNHYEPLRSAFGAYVGETTFIGNCNLVVEGLADQVLLAGAATHLRRVGSAETETLDLNHLTIVPAGSASHVPYLVFLARGRDIEQPPVIVLLDSDGAGKDAAKALKKGGPRGRQLLRPSLILEVSDVPEVRPAIDGPMVIEDLVPLPIAMGAAVRYAKEIGEMERQDLAALTPSFVAKAYDKSTGVLSALTQSLASIRAGHPIHLDKVGFARFVLEEVEERRRAAARQDQDARDLVSAFETNFKALFVRLNAMRREAERESRGERVSFRVERAKKSFTLDHPRGATKEQAAILLEEIEVVLDGTRESDEIRTEIQRIRRDFQLDAGLREQVPDLKAFAQRLERLKYSGKLATQDKGEEREPSGSGNVEGTHQAPGEDLEAKPDGKGGSSAAIAAVQKDRPAVPGAGA